MVRFRSSLIAAALLLAGCANDEASPNSGIQDPPAQRRAAIAEMRRPVLRPRALWQAEAPPSCRSPRLEEAHASVLSAAGMLTPARSGVDAVTEGGSGIPEVADAAREQGCKATARRLYDPVIAIYTGGAYAALRPRARIGIDDRRQ